MMLGFFKRMFGPKYTPPSGDGTPDGDWRRGDLAVCVESTWTELQTGKPSRIHPEKGEVYRVSDVDFWQGIHVLGLCEFEAGYRATAISFRKAVIDKDEACEAEFKKLLKRSKRKVSAPA